MESEGTRLELAIVPGSDPITGRIRLADGAELEFRGYLQLAGVLERLRQGLAPLDPSPAPERRAEP